MSKQPGSEMKNVKTVVEVNGDRIRIRIFRNLPSENAEVSEFEIDIHEKCVDVYQTAHRSGIQQLEATVPTRYRIYSCPGCEDSDIPGRHYKHNDTTSGQFVNCQECNRDGDLSP